jgi:hypothetical protein
LDSDLESSPVTSRSGGCTPDTPFGSRPAAAGLDWAWEDAARLPPAVGKEEGAYFGAGLRGAFIVIVWPASRRTTSKKKGVSVAPINVPSFQWKVEGHSRCSFALLEFLFLARFTGKESVAKESPRHV